MKGRILHGGIMNCRQWEMWVKAFLVSLKSHCHSISLHRGMALLWFFQSRYQKSAMQRWPFLNRTYVLRNLTPRPHPPKKRFQKNIGYEVDVFWHLIKLQCFLKRENPQVFMFSSSQRWIIYSFFSFCHLLRLF